MRGGEGLTLLSFEVFPISFHFQASRINVVWIDDCGSGVCPNRLSMAKVSKALMADGLTIAYQEWGRGEPFPLLFC